MAGQKRCKVKARNSERGGGGGGPGAATTGTKHAPLRPFSLPPTQTAAAPPAPAPQVPLGSVTPLAACQPSAAGVALLLDAKLQGQPRIFVHPLDNTATCVLSPAGLEAYLRWGGAAPCPELHRTAPHRTVCPAPHRPQRTACRALRRPAIACASLPESCTALVAEAMGIAPHGWAGCWGPP